MNHRQLIVFVVFLLIIAAGCLEMGGVSPGTSESDSYSFDIQGIAAEKRVTDEKGEGLSEILDRKIISTASLTIEVKEVQTAFNEITRITQDSGGFISGSSIYDVRGRYNGQMTVRIPQKDFYSVIEQIEAVGTFRSKQISEQDVTEEFIDLNARLGNLKKQEIRLQEILEMATTVKDVLEVEHELERVRGEIERLTGRLNFLNQSIEMSTITVTLTEPAPITGEGWGITDALRQAVRGFIDTIKGIIIFIGYILPVLIFTAIVVLIALGFKRKVLPKIKG